MKYLIKYSPEMTTKSRIVRIRFCKQLRKNLARLLRRHHGLVDKATAPQSADSIEVHASWDHLTIAIPTAHEALCPPIEETLRNTPGIWSFNRVQAFPLGTLETLLEQTVALYEHRLAGKTFAVRCKRSGGHDFSSMDIERYLGAGLLRLTTAKAVNLRQPDVTVALEIRNRKVFIVDENLSGIGGFPLGTQDSVLSLLSGGFDSAVSSFLAMKRGLRTHFLFFNLGGREHEVAVKEVAYYLWQKFGASHAVSFISVPFEAVVGEILEKVDNSQMGVVLKRMMLRAANAVAADLRVEALVTGESVAQVSSQTLVNLAVIDEVSDMMVLRPLSMSDKQDIVDTARRIGTAEFSAVIPEYCGVISVKPTTRAKRRRIIREEEEFRFAILDKALADRVVFDIRSMQAADKQPDVPVPEVAIPEASAVIIDIRHPEEEELSPLVLDANDVMQLPFYRLNLGFASLPSDQQYLLYCNKGIMSRLHASHLREQGHANVGVYRPVSS